MIPHHHIIKERLVRSINNIFCISSLFLSVVSICFIASAKSFPSFKSTEASVVDITYQIYQGGIWLNESRESLRYDNNSRLIEKDLYAWNDSDEWQEEEIFLWEYNSSGNETLYTRQKPGKADFIEQGRCIYELDSNSIIIVKTQQMRFSEDDDWKNTSKDYYMYDTFGNIVDETVKTWDSTISDWVNYERTIYEYDSAGREVLTSFYRWIEFYINWRLRWRTENIYDQSGIKKEMLYVTWYSDGGEVEQGFRYLYTYNDDLTLYETDVQEFIDHEWINNSKTVCFYDTDCNIIEKIMYQWEEEQWLADSRELYEYNSTSTMLSHYSGTELSLEEMALDINQFRDLTTVVSFKLNREQSVSIYVYDVSGRIIKKLLNGKRCVAGSHNIIWDCRSDEGRTVPSGLYIVRVIKEKNLESRKVILTR